MIPVGGLGQDPVVVVSDLSRFIKLRSLIRTDLLHGYPVHAQTQTPFLASYSALDRTHWIAGFKGLSG